MLVKNHMSTELITITPETKIHDAVELMKTHRIHRLPVLKKGVLVGLITEGTIQEAMPSKATSLSVYEVNYLLTKTTVADIMISDVLTIFEDSLIEEAVFQMKEGNVGVLPVLNKEKQLVGVITTTDVFEAFLSITGFSQTGMRLTIRIATDKEGILAKLTQLLTDNGLNIRQVVVYRTGDSTLVVIQVVGEGTKDVSELLTGAGYDIESIFETFAD